MDFKKLQEYTKRLKDRGASSGRVAAAAAKLAKAKAASPEGKLKERLGKSAAAGSSIAKGRLTGKARAEGFSRDDRSRNVSRVEVTKDRGSRYEVDVDGQSHVVHKSEMRGFKVGDVGTLEHDPVADKETFHNDGGPKEDHKMNRAEREKAYGHVANQDAGADPEGIRAHQRP